MPRTPERLGVFPPEARAQVTALACSLPRQQGVPLARWSAAELACQASSLLGQHTPSSSTIRRWLRAERLRPWRYRSWQHIHDPVAFRKRAAPVLWLYEHAQRLLEGGTWLLCVDEKSSIQAREAEDGPRAAVAQHPQQQSPRYQRRGATQLFGALSVADGVVLGRCASRKRFVEFQAFVREVVAPEAQRRQVHTVALVLDNGPTHAPKQFRQWLRAIARREQWSFGVQLFWLPTRASWLDQIEIWFSILQRKLLQPNHFVSLQDLQAAIAAFITHYNQTAQPIKWSYTVEKLDQKLKRKPGSTL